MKIGATLGVLLTLFYTVGLLAQSNPSQQDFHTTNPLSLALAADKQLDSTRLSIRNDRDSLGLSERAVFIYDSLGQEIRSLNFNYDINTDTLRWIEQINTDYVDDKVIAIAALRQNGQWMNVSQYTETYREPEVLLQSLNQLWDTPSNTYLNNSQDFYIYNGTATVPDTILQQRWNMGQWENHFLIIEHYSSPERKDSSETLAWDESLQTWQPSTKQFSTYDGAGRPIGFQFFSWSPMENRYISNLMVDETYNSEGLKDSTRSISLFGGFYNEVLSVFRYDSQGLLSSDTVYTTIDPNGIPARVNFQDYTYDSDGDLLLRQTYDSPPGQAGILSNQIAFFYAPAGPNTALIPVEEATKIDCWFANPYVRHSSIRCSNSKDRPRVEARVYDLQGRMWAVQDLGQMESFDFQIDASLAPGLYFLHLTDGQRMLGQHKLLVVE